MDTLQSGIALVARSQDLCQASLQSLEVMPNCGKVPLRLESQELRLQIRVLMKPRSREPRAILAEQIVSLARLLRVHFGTGTSTYDQLRRNIHTYVLADQVCNAQETGSRILTE
jgi:hypothetical protein